MMKTRIGRILKIGHDPVDHRRVPHAPCDQVVEQPHADGGHRHSQDRVAVAEAVEERPERGADKDPVEAVASHRAGPEPDRGVEARVVAEPGLGVDEHAGVEAGLADREGLEDEREHQHSGARDRPGDQRPEDAGRHPETRRQREHTGPDHPADHHRGQRGNAHLRDDALCGRRVGLACSCGLLELGGFDLLNPEACPQHGPAWKYPCCWCTAGRPGSSSSAIAASTSSLG